MRIISGERGNLTHEQARPWRNTLGRILSPEAVAKQQLPIFAPAFAARVRGIVARGGQVLWYKESRNLAFSVAARATLGSVLSEADLAALYPKFQVLSKGAFALVRGRSLCVRARAQQLSSGVPSPSSPVEYVQRPCCVSTQDDTVGG
jgi:hypothetical protein